MIFPLLEKESKISQKEYTKQRSKPSAILLSSLLSSLSIYNIHKNLIIIYEKSFYVSFICSFLITTLTNKASILQYKMEKIYIYDYYGTAKKKTEKSTNGKGILSFCIKILSA